MPFAWFAVDAALSFLAALTFYYTLGASSRRRLLVLVAAVAVILLWPLLVPERAKFLRLLASVLAVTFSIKLYDLHLGAGAGARGTPRPAVRPTLLRFIVFLWNPFSLVERTIDASPDAPHKAPVRRFCTAAGATVAALVVAFLTCHFDWSDFPFFIEHSAKVIAFFLVLFPFSVAAAVAWRLAGAPARDIMNNPFAARTPADFWRRYNRPVHELLEEDVYKLAAGRRRRDRLGWRAARATLLAFLVSGVIHEYVFAIPIGRVQGYQLVFFLIQGLAVAATARVKPRGWRVAPWVAVTLAFNLTSGVLFFASMNHVVPLYQHRPPLWDE